MYGKVSLDGNFVDEGSITLLPQSDNDGPAANTTIRKGEYRFDKREGPAVGAYRVLVMRPAWGPTKGEAFKANMSASPPKTEWEHQVDVPAVEVFEHNINLK